MVRSSFFGAARRQNSDLERRGGQGARNISCRIQRRDLQQSEEGHAAFLCSQYSRAEWCTAERLGDGQQEQMLGQKQKDGGWQQGW